MEGAVTIGTGRLFQRRNDSDGKVFVSVKELLDKEQNMMIMIMINNGKK